MLCTCILWYNLILIINKRIKTIINKFQVTLNGRYKMRTFNTIEEIKLELIEGNLIIKESVTINCNIPRGTIYNLTCGDLTCLNLNCNNLSYNAICSSYNSISCNSYEIRRQNGHAPITLDGSLTIKNTESKDKLKEELQAIKSKINKIEKRIYSYHNRCRI